MPTPRNYRKGGDEKKGRKGLLSEKALSFHGRSGRVVLDLEETLPRPRTVPDLVLVAGERVDPGLPDLMVVQERRKLTKLLLNVTIQRSLGAVQVVMPPEATAEDLIMAVLKQYAKEGRRLILPSTHPSGFDLHYCQFSLESLDREEKLMALGSRNFFLHPKTVGEATRDGGSMRNSTAVELLKRSC